MRRSVLKRTAAYAMALVSGILASTLFAERVLGSARIDALEPAKVRQGETVLLTVRGEGLPQGSLAVEFFPQQIAVLSILSASEAEVVIQAKVSSLAPPGNYNLVIYNQLGDEATAAGLLSVVSDVSAPLFSAYEPRRIEAGTHTAAIVINGTMVTPEAVAQLRMEWQAGAARVDNLNTVFSYVDPRTAVVTVEGSFAPGPLRGRILLNGTPIYLVDIEVEGSGATILGHSPAQCVAGDQQVVFRLLASEVTPAVTGSLSASLTCGDKVISALGMRAVDAGTVEVTFAGPLAPGQYVLSVMEQSVVIYSGEVEIAAPPDPAPALAEQASGSSGTQSSGAVQADMKEQAGAPTAPGEEAEGATVSAGSHEPDLMPQASEEGAQAPAGEIASDYVFELGDPPGADAPLTVTVAARDGNAALEDLKVSLSVDGQYLENILSTVRSGRLVCIFAPPRNGWPTDLEALLIVRQPDGLTVLEPVVLLAGAARLPARGAGVHQQNTPVLGRERMREGRTGRSKESGQFTLELDGIRFSLSVPQSLADGVDWGTLGVSSDSPLLSANLPHLKPEAQGTAEDAAAVDVLLRRDREAIPDDAWELLVELLAEGPPVKLIVSFPVLGDPLVLVGPM